MNNNFKSVQETLSKYGVKVSIDDSIKGYIKKLSYGISKIENEHVRTEAIKEISSVLSNFPFITKGMIK